MKIVQLYDSYFIKGGVERVLALLLNSWAADGHDVSLLVREGQVTDVYPLHADIKRSSLMHAPQPGRGRRLLNYVQDIFAIRRQPDVRGADILIANGPWCALLSILALKFPLRLRGAPALIVCDHNNPAAFGSLTRFTCRLLYRHADCVLSLTQPQAKLYQEFVHRITVISNPVNLPTPEQPIDAVPDNQVLAVGRLAYQKGFDYLLQAWALVTEQRPDAHLTIIGEGPEQSALHTQAEQLGISAQLTWLPFTNQIFQYYQRATLLAVSSRYEGQGLVLLEAQACGLPIVSFDCDFGPREIIADGQDGLLCDPANPAALAKGILQLLNEPELCTDMRNNARVAAAKYMLPQVLQQWDALFEKLVASQKTTTP
ncbi:MULTISPECIES: glycosyltransferase family 4 protein [Alcaligenes]|uniref:Glycosyltransferase family 4 protein n=1 Tax=Alcaligenes faecalis TaxID=511 RepID=A0AAE9KQ84_ALCFA|nr:glycosyltransferase family 4 protein [Alcaligenes faecalis]UPL21891.1 glycosyltransferase family 4 protein [Alcaligenes faecalis]